MANPQNNLQFKKTLTDFWHFSFMGHEFSSLPYISENGPKITFKTNLIFYLSSKFSLEYFAYRQNSLIE